MYIIFVDGRSAWNGFSKAAFKNWGPMLRLAIPGVIMVASEWGAFEITSLAASYIGVSELAAQSILNTTASIVFQAPFAVSVAVSTRVGNLIGGKLGRAAKISCDVGLLMAVVLALGTAIVLYLLRSSWGFLFTNDPTVVQLVSDLMALLAFFEIFDCLGAIAGGILRGMGRQSIGAFVNVPCYYVFGLPIGLTLTFKADYGLYGIWIGMLIALVLVAGIEIFFILRTNWDQLLDRTEARLARDRHDD